ncbi:matrix protein [Potato yellow dwarf virus]|uniref:Matrix protein n=2 Tax=Alphanucleorhabdovirus tuberosum TaxID=2749927 RepID=D5L203_9RHAB|nr:matrix protein [Potato yellow dwarf virus]ADE45272.1 matrix protein [Potato yellow dwarf virus]QYA72295.1 matrix protein [Alphanucleorhabdovirus tuberosum]
MISMIGSRRPIRREVYLASKEGEVTLQKEKTGILISLNYIVKIHLYDLVLRDEIENQGISYPDLFKYVEDQIGLPPNNPEAIIRSPDMTNSQVKELIMLAKLHAMHTEEKITVFTQKTDFSEKTPTLYLKVGESILRNDHDPHVVEVIYRDSDPLPKGEYQLNMTRQYKGDSDQIKCEITFAMFVRTPPRNNNHVSARLNLMVLLSKYSNELKKTVSDPLKNLLKRKSDTTIPTKTDGSKRAFLPSMLKMLSP